MKLNDLVEDAKALVKLSPNSVAQREAELKVILLHIGHGVHRVADALDRLGFDREGVDGRHPGIGEAFIMALRENWPEMNEVLEKLATAVERLE